MPTAHQPIELDVAVIGGGVAGLWTANALKKAGYRFALFSQGPLGAGQSLAAQGVIHGGLKYALGGKLNDSSEELKSMPERWKRELPGVKVLSECQYLWSLPGMLSKAVSFFGSSAVAGRSRKLKREEFPEVFRSKKYRGNVFRIEEQVLDPQSIIAELAKPIENSVYQIDWKRTEFIFENNEPVGLRFLETDQVVRAKRFVFTAGKGNAELLAKCGLKRPEMQVRPLHQVIIKKNGLPDFFSVCTGNTPKPPIVLTTHTDQDGRAVWYVGGNLAEADGVDRSESAQIEFAQSWFSKHMPWIDLTDAEWSTCRIDRAEPKTKSGSRPATGFCERADGAKNIYVGWPTKLALAPDLSDSAMRFLKQDGVEPTAENVSLDFLPKAEMEAAVWF